ncbi:MAG: hypothetical protein HZB51_06240 [Chloroflexi bacterium]|nr:hypothetical protein [Chloroflexota bacterium]
MNQTVAKIKSLGRFAPILLIVLPLVVLIALLGLYFASHVFTASSPTALTPPTNPVIEERWGVRVTQIGVTADGGLVDVRFVVIDPDKALAMMQEEKNLPVLVAEESNALVNSAAMMSARHTLQPGRTYFLLYRNTRSAIKPGAQVSVFFRDPLSNDGKTIRLEHFIAQ